MVHGSPIFTALLAEAERIREIRAADSKVLPNHSVQALEQGLDYLGGRDILSSLDISINKVSPNVLQHRQAAERIMCGDISQTLPAINSTIHLVVCTNETDSEMERTALRLKVYPFLEEMCHTLGLEFNYVELRGLSFNDPEAILTNAPKFDEIQKAFETSAGPTFLCLLGNKLGPLTLPESISKTDFAKLNTYLKSCTSNAAQIKLSTKDIALFESWYVLEGDSYLLQKSKAKNHTTSEITVIRNRLDVILRMGAKGAFPSEVDRQKFFVSPVEQELGFALQLDSELQGGKKIAYFRRNLIGLEEETTKEYSNYIDMLYNSESTKAMLDVEAQKKLNDIVNQAIPDQSYQIKWSDFTGAEGKLDAQKKYIDALVDDAAAVCGRAIIDQYPFVAAAKEDAILDEVLIHKSTLLDLCTTAEGLDLRNELKGHIEKAAYYVVQDLCEDAPIIVVYDALGSIKSQAMALATREMISKYLKKDGVVVYRFIGATRDSSNIRATLFSICSQIARAYNAEGEIWTLLASELMESSKKISASKEYEQQAIRNLVKVLEKCMLLASEERPLLIALDGLNKFTDDTGRKTNMFDWLPQSIPNHIHMILSVSTHDGTGPAAFNSLKKSLPKAIYHAVRTQSYTSSISRTNSNSKLSQTGEVTLENMKCISPMCGLLEGPCYSSTCAKRLSYSALMHDAVSTSGVALGSTSCYSSTCASTAICCCYSPSCGRFGTLSFTLDKADSDDTISVDDSVATISATPPPPLEKVDIRRKSVFSIYGPNKTIRRESVTSSITLVSQQYLEDEKPARSRPQSLLDELRVVANSIVTSTNVPPPSASKSRPQSILDQFNETNNLTSQTVTSKSIRSRPQSILDDLKDASYTAKLPKSRRQSLMDSFSDINTKSVKSRPQSILDDTSKPPKSRRQSILEGLSDVASSLVATATSPTKPPASRRQSLIGDLGGVATSVIASASEAAKMLGIVSETAESQTVERSLEVVEPTEEVPEFESEYISKYPPPQDPQEAAEYYTKLTAIYTDNAPLSHFELGRLYERGIFGFSKDSVGFKNLNVAATHYRQAAEQGHIESQYRYAVFLEKGTGGVQKNFSEAVKWYAISAEGDLTNGSQNAMVRLADCYRTGEGSLPKDTRECVRLLRKAVGLGSVDAMYKLGECLEKGEGVEKPNPQEAVSYYRQAAQEGLAQAQCALGRCYLLGIGMSRYPAAGFKFFEKAAAQELSEGEYYLGRCYLGGLGVTKDPKMAVRLLQRASKNGHIEAKYYLATCYERGYGIETNKIEAIKLFKVAGDEGHAAALYQLGLAYLNGEGVPRYPIVAAKYFERSADKKYVEGEFMLAECYKNGNGVSKDPLTALKLYQRAADQGHAGAQLNIGMYYSKGIGVSSDPKKAVELYKKSIEKENLPSALYNLGMCYLKGTGVKRDPVAALQNFEKAAHQDHWGACYQCGCAYRDGEGTTADGTKALSYFEMAAKACSHAGSCYEAGMLLAGLRSLPKKPTKNTKKAANYFSIAAAEGDSEAQYQYGVCLERGIGVSSDPVGAVHWYRQSAESGHANAMYNLAAMIEAGDGTTRNLNEALKYYELSANKGVVGAQFRLAEIYELGSFGKVTKPDEQIALSYYHQAANRGHATAQNILGLFYLSGKGGVQRDYEMAVSYFSMAAEQNIAESQFKLGVLYETGDGTEVNLTRAVELYQNAATQKHPEAQRALGMCYERGDGGLEVNPKKAFELYDAAVISGLPSAIVNLARCYEEGIGTEINIPQALELYQRAADMGDPHAQFNLGAMYERGEPEEFITCDLSAALRYYELAATQGLAVAMFNLAVLLETGMGELEPNDEKAIEWYEKAAEEGIAAAQVNLARRYEVGDGVPQNSDLCVQYYHKAANRGDPHAQCVLGSYYRAGLVVQQDIALAASFFQLAADQGLAEAKFRLAVLYEEGEGVEKNYKTAIELHRQAVEEAEHVGSKISLARIYHHGVEDIPADIELAMELYQSAASEGDGIGAYHLARALENGDLIKANMDPNEPDQTISIPVEDYLSAINYYKLAGETGLISAKYRVAVMLQEGHPQIPPNYSEAVFYLTEASDEGLVDARLRLAETYEQGIGIGKDLSKALELYKSIAEIDEVAQSKSIELSRTVSPDLFTSVRKWWSGSATAATAPVEAEKSMSPVAESVLANWWRRS